MPKLRDRNGDRATERTLVTGFLGFEGFAVNPSALLAESGGRPFELIEVSYPAVDRFIAAVESHRFDRLVLMGVAGKSSHMRLEQVAHNRVGKRPDVRGFSPCTGSGIVPIDPDGPDRLRGTLWQRHPALTWVAPDFQSSENAGDYLCNYLYYRAMQRFGNTHAVGFLHVPPLDAMELPTQQRLLAQILETIET